eukprot:c8880_g1_i1.p1 GENE.c8880_g1_i1~~c8880_g1_i1.p1  ORF type:complete len:269 (+),score=48.32 c8880_g1_i1:246-1052(+)
MTALKNYNGTKQQISTNHLISSPPEDLLRIQFRGRIIHVRKEEHVYAAVNSLLHKRLKSRSCDPMGFDMEWRPEDPTKAEINKVALIQISTASTCLLFHMLELGHMPDALRSVLEDASVQKVCHGFDTSDRLRLERDFGVFAQNVVDTAMLARCLGNRHCGLKSLVNQHFFPLYLDKTLATSDWAAQWLTPAQTLYAATDAWVTRELFLKLLAMQSPESLKSLPGLGMTNQVCYPSPLITAQPQSQLHLPYRPDKRSPIAVIAPQTPS